MRAFSVLACLALTLLIYPFTVNSPARAQEAAPEAPANLLPIVAVKLTPGSDIEAVATAHGALPRNRVGSLAGWWVIEFADAPTAQLALPLLQEDPDVEEAQAQFKRDFHYRSNDPFFGQQWHLKQTTGAHVNAEPAWNAGFDGTGVKLMVCDDSLEHTHPDLAPNYNATDSFDYADNDADPSPMSAQEQHGTCTGGMAAARGDNNLGVSGVAHHASLSGIRMDANFPDAQVAAALSHNQGSIDIYSNSWGPGPWEDMGTLTRQAIEQGVANGRGGKGCIYVWACGNGRYWGDNGNNDPFQTMPGTISVASIARDGLVADHSEKGACILVAAPAGVSSGGQGGAGGNVVITDRTGTDGYGGHTDDDYTNAFGGTSASCPEVAGVVALMLDANPNLTWRDVQHILVRTANSTFNGSGFAANGAGRRVHDTLGFGCVDAGAAVAMAQTWTNVPAQQSAQSTQGTGGNLGMTALTRTVTFANNMDLEHVLIDFTANHMWWDLLDVTLTSPSGTVSKLVEANMMMPFPMGNPAPAGGTWQFMTTHCWDENAAGTWTLRVTDASGMGGSLTSWRLTFLGTNSTPVPPTPTINVSGTSLSFVAVDAVTPTAEKTLTVSGTALSSDVNATAPAGFQIATSPTGPWLGAMTLTQTGGTLASTNVYVRFDPNQSGGTAASGPLTFASAGAATKTVNLTGGIAGQGGTVNTSGGKAGGGGGCTANTGGATLLLIALLGLGLTAMHRRFGARCVS